MPIQVVPNGKSFLELVDVVEPDPGSVEIMPGHFATKAHLITYRMPEEVRVRWVDTIDDPENIVECHDIAFYKGERLFFHHLDIVGAKGPHGKVHMAMQKAKRKV